MEYMEQLLQEWCDYCEGRQEFDTGDFYTLFHDDISDDHIKTALSYFPNKDDLYVRVKKVRDVNYRTAESSKISQSNLIDLAQKDLQEKRAACVAENDDEVVAAIDIAKPRFVEDDEALFTAKSGIDSNYQSSVAYYLGAKRISHDKTYHALFEAFYGLTNTYEIAWYLGAPLIDTDINLDYYFDLWSAGGDYALTETELLVTRRNT
ncbi:MAG: hypothetical protein ABJL11_17670 [Parasphingorhabdus sp.]